MNEQERTILFVDDEKPILSSLERNLMREPYRKIFANSAHEGLEHLERENIHVVVSDIRMPEMDGLTFLRKVREQHPDVIRMVLSGTADIAGVINAINSGEVYRYVTKPLSELAEFRAILRQAIEYYDLQQSRRELIAQLEQNNRELTRWRERMAHELEVAAQVQRRILATRPILSKRYMALFAYQPSLSIGGDFFDAIPWPDGRLCVYIGDVAGHGVGSALLSTLLKVTVSDLIRAHFDEGPAAICRRFNTFLHEHIQNDEFFATFFIAFYNPVTTVWRAFNCGHPPPLLLASDGFSEVFQLSADGAIPLGILGDTQHFPTDNEIAWTSEQGDTLLLYTDGLIEARHRETGAECGTEGLRQLASPLAQSPHFLIKPPQLLACMEQAYELTADDCCAITIRCTRENEILLEMHIPPKLERVGLLAETIEQKLLDTGWPAERASMAKLIVMEYGVNIVRYGRLKAHHSIECQLTLRHKRAGLLFRDPGRRWSFEESIARAANNPLEVENGRGLLMMQSLSEYLEIYRHMDHNYGLFIIAQESEAE